MITQLSSFGPNYTLRIFLFLNFFKNLMYEIKFDLISLKLYVEII